jgi:hypothetical protein
MISSKDTSRQKMNAPDSAKESVYLLMRDDNLRRPKVE